MLDLSQPHPLADIVASVDAKTPIGSAMRTAEWAGMPAGLRDQAFFSASVESTRFLQRAKDGIAEIIDRAKGTNANGETYWKMDRARLLADLRRYGEELALKRPDGRANGQIREGDITDPLSIARLRLIINTQLEMAYGKADWLTGMDPDLLNAFPAWELVRIEPRMVPRDWETRWFEAAQQVGWDGVARDALDAGRMIALKTSPIWVAISRFQKPHPPFDFNSGMGVEDIDRSEAEDLEIIGADEELQPNVAAYQDTLKASLNGISPELQKDLERKLASHVTDARGSEVPNQVQIEKGEIKLITPRSTTVIDPGAWTTLRALMPDVQRADLRALASARPSSSITVGLDESGGVTFNVRDADRTTYRKLRQDEFGDVVIENESFYLRQAARGRKEGALTLLRQAQAAQRLGVRYLSTYAAQNHVADKASQLNGAVVWPRYGYDGPLPPDLVNLAGEDLGVQVETVQELLLLPGAELWWEKHAQSLALTFDLSDASDSINLLHDYLRKKSARKV
jgi:hypothetical protein